MSEKEQGTYPYGPPVLDKVEGWYLDSDNSLICEDCAKKSNTWDEVPQFRPVTKVEVLSADDTCDSCSCSPEGWEIDDAASTDET